MMKVRQISYICTPNAEVAQSVEHRPFKAVVQGSSPCRLTISLFPFCFLLFFSFKF